MKILHVVFSCNRMQYLTKTIESWSNLDYGNHTVTRLIVDDYPRTRNDAIFEMLGKVHNCLLWRNTENLGLSVTWSNFFDWLKNQDYDYVLHQEDDIVLTEPIKIDTLIDLLETDSKMASVILRRQSWYFNETEPKKEETDLPWKSYWYTKEIDIFSPIFSLYRKNISEHPFKEYWGFNLNEGMIGVYLEQQHQMYSALLKNSDGKNLIMHIGEESTGKRILPNEPRYEYFAHIDPNKVYRSRDGVLIE